MDYSDTSYEFPLQRSKDPLSIIQQCHSMLRASSRTHDTVTSESGSETFPVIADFLARDEEKVDRTANPCLLSWIKTFCAGIK